MHTADTLNELVDDFLALPQQPSEHFVDFVLANGFTLELWAEEDLRGAAMRLLNTDDMLVIEAWLENFQNFTGQPVCYETPRRRVVANPRKEKLWSYARECYAFARDRIFELRRRGRPAWLQPYSQDPSRPLRNFCVEASGLMLACALLKDLPVSVRVASAWISDDSDEGYYHDVVVFYQPGSGELWVDPSAHADLRECGRLANYEIDWVNPGLALQKISELLTLPERRKLGL